MTRRLISTGSPFERAAGYSRAVVQGPWCFVAGTTGYDYTNMTMPDGVAEQAENAMTTIARALAQAGFSLRDVVRAHYHVTDAAYADAVFLVVGARFRDIRPAATMTVSGLIEIEVTALKA
jgi:enamine deaminase RidA (YjgF/YER057c/UK114 family)